MTDKPKRAGTMSDERDTYRAKTPPAGVAEQIGLSVPAQVDDECTGKYTGAELAAERKKRPTDERVARLETKHDKLDEKVDAIHGDVREMRGELKTALGFMQGAQVQVGETTRARISTNGKIIIAIVGAAITTIGTIIVAVLA